MTAVRLGSASPDVDQPIRVLLASGDRVFADHLCTCLAAKNMAVTVWAAPAGGLLPDLALTDVLLVETYGLDEAQRELLDALRDAAPLVEVVAISSDPAVEDAVQALRAGVFAVLEYPVSSDVIANEITRAGERKRRAEHRIRQLDGEARWGGAARTVGGVEHGRETAPGEEGRER